MPKLQSVWRYSLASTVLVLGIAVGAGSALAQFRGGGGGGGRDPDPQPRQGDPSAVDPGIRGGAVGAGGPITGLSTNELNFFNAALTNRFENVDAVANGLGPGFNLNSCAGCHAYPAVGGSSPPTNNPEVAVATLDGATNVVPSFVTINGPIREARFVTNPDGTPDGGVHDLFTITGRADAPGCTLAQPNFAAAVAANNVIFRIPTPVFGTGLVENTSDEALRASFAASAAQRSSLGISGNFNTSGNTGNITRFGWKAQNPSLLVFSAEAYNVEMGVTNDGFPNERNSPPASCQFNPLPEDTTNLTDSPPASNSPASDFSSDLINFSFYMRTLAPPTPASSSTSTTSSTSTMQVASADAASVMSAAAGTSSTSSTGSTGAADPSLGQQVFQNIGCSGCHTTTMTSGNSEIGPAETNVTFNPFSDFAIHDMGTGLADRVSQGAANGQQFRSAPLWGVGQRAFFLHDGRTNNIVTAIEDHASSGSEANTVIENFNSLSQTNQQALVNFLRSL
jgi:CxxC motif-containing protein (DUF1111 family)